MPSKLERFQHAGGFHFLTFSCHGRLPYLATAAACDLFERSLEMVRRRYVFFVRAIQALKTSISKQSVQRPFWLVRYYDFNVRSEAKRIEKLRYMHRNPVARGLVNRPGEWKWSSFRHYLTGEPGIVEIESPWTVGRRLGLKMLRE
jgi:putative transposase